MFFFTALKSSADDSPGICIGPCLAIGSAGSGGRSPVHTDAIEAQIISGAWQRPANGDRVQLANGTSKEWSLATTNKDGWFTNDALDGGYAYVPVIAQSDCVMLLEAEGDDVVYMNGGIRPGDPYSYGYVHLPVSLHEGTNDFLFRCVYGQFKFRLFSPPAPVSLNIADATLPDLIAGEKMDTWGAVVVVNATGETQTGLVIRCSITGKRTVETAVPAILPFSARKVGFHIRGNIPEMAGGSPQTIRGVLPDTPQNDSKELKTDLQLTLLSKAAHGRMTLDHTNIAVRIRRPDQIQKRTFISGIDGSVQYWALNPAQPVHAEHPPLALFFSLHGASVEALGQAEAYEPKSWGNIVVPTNRRPYGFDWEDWGRLDALEV
ncbi:MAG TPA: hypothetical protein VME24_07555, partial [Alphaproteobacteria bacterium]|nr:hypothetical protein [Alphaproteobacteria bacterium]